MGEKKCESFHCQNETDKNFCSEKCKTDELLEILKNAVSFFGWNGSHSLTRKAEMLIKEYAPKDKTEDDVAKSCDPRPHMPAMVKWPDMHRDGLD